MVHPRGAMSTQKLAVLYYYTIQQNEGIKPAANPLHFLFTLSQSLSHNHIEFLQYNTIPYIAILQCFSFIGEIPWENTTVNPIPWVRKTVGQQTYQKIFFGE